LQTRPDAEDWQNPRPIPGPRGKIPTPVPPNAQIEAIINRMRGAVRVRSRGSLGVSARVGDRKLPDAEIADNIIAMIQAVQKKLPNATRTQDSGREDHDGEACQEQGRRGLSRQVQVQKREPAPKGRDGPAHRQALQGPPRARRHQALEGKVGPAHGCQEGLRGRRRSSSSKNKLAILGSRIGHQERRRGPEAPRRAERADFLKAGPLQALSHAGENRVNLAARRGT